MQQLVRSEPILFFCPIYAVFVHRSLDRRRNKHPACHEMRTVVTTHSLLCFPTLRDRCHRLLNASREVESHTHSIPIYPPAFPSKLNHSPLSTYSQTGPASQSVNQSTPEQATPEKPDQITNVNPIPYYPPLPFLPHLTSHTPHTR